MDFDLDLDVDPIKNNFINKLQSIKLKTSKLEETLKSYQEETKKILNSSTNHDIEITNTAIKIYNGKYAIWFSICNKSDGELNDFNVIVNYSTPTPILYTYTFLKNFQPVTCIQSGENVDLIIVLGCPEYLNALQIHLSVTFSCSMNIEEKFTKSFVILLESKDFVDQKKIITESKLLESDLINICSAMMCSPKTKTVFKFEKVSTYVNSLLEIDCGLMRLNINSSEKSCFLAYNISPVFNGTILFIENINKDFMDCTFYYRNDKSFLVIIHHVLRNIPIVAIIPKHYEFIYKNYNKEDLRLQFLNEKQLMSELLKRPKGCKNFQDFKLKLFDLQNKTNFTYVALKLSD